MLLDEITLKNSLRTLMINSPGAKSASVQIWFKAGSSLESKEDQGIAHFLEHMFFKGTKKHPGSQIASTIESFGGEVNAFTSFDYTCYYINVPASQISEATNILLDMVSNPMFLEKDLIPEREVVFEEYRRSLDSASQYNFFEIQKNFFTKTYQHPILGNEKTIKNFSKEQLISFRKKFYNLSNSLFVIAGDIKNKDALIKIIEKYKLPEGPKTKYSSFSLKDKSPIKSHHKATNQASINFIIQSPNYTSESGAIEDLALNCLTYGDTSPLYKALITDTNLANSIGGSTLFFNKNGTHLIKLAAPVEHLENCLKELQKKLQNILRTGFKREEIDRIRKQYIASKIYEKETIESYAFSLGYGFAQTGDLQCEEKFINKMKMASRQDVHRALLNIFERNIHISIQLPQNSQKINEKLFDNFRKSINDHAKKYHKTLHDHTFEVSKFDPEVRIYNIKNNVHFIYRQNEMTPTFALNTYIKGGVGYESSRDNGIYNLIAKCLTYGHTHSDYETLKQTLEVCSSYLNGFSGNNTYGLTMHGLSEHFSQITSHFFHSLLEPKIPNKFLNIEKELIKRSLFLQKEDPVKVCFSAFKKLVFNNHPYQMNLIGTEDSLKNLTRKALLDKHHRCLEKSEIVFTYCGDLPANYVIEEISHHIDKLKSRSAEKRSLKKVKPLYKERIQIEFDREQTHIVVGKSAPKSSTDEDLMLRMLTSYLSGQSSELFVKVRDEMGLCYATQPIHLPAVDAAYFGIYIGAGADKKDQAIEEILKILNRLQAKGVSASEFSRIQKMMIGQNEINVQTNDDYANFYSIPFLQGLGLDYQHKTLLKMQKLKKDDFNKFLKSYLVNDWNIVEVGPKA